MNNKKYRVVLEDKKTSKCMIVTLRLSKLSELMDTLYQEVSPSKGMYVTRYYQVGE